MQFPCTQKNGPPDRVPWEFGKDLQCQCQPMPHTFCPHSTPLLPGMASSCCECTVCVGRANIIPGQPWLLLQGAISCYVLAFAPNHRHPCLTVPPNWPFGDCLLPSCIGLCYISPFGGRKSPLLSPSGMQHVAEDGSRLNWVEVLSVECASTSSLPGHPPPYSHISHFDILTSGPYLKCQQKLWTGNDQFKNV